MTNIIHMTSYALAARWHLKPRTLERWRWQKKGPSYCKIGNRILYRISDIEDFEKQGAHPL